MSDRRKSPNGALRARLLAGVALIACVHTGQAMAQEVPAVDPSPVQTPPADGLPDGSVYLEADDATRDGDRVLAKGTEDERVFARFNQNTLRAAEVTYNVETGVATAAGKVELTDPRGSVVHAGQLELDSEQNTGVATDVALRLENGASLMAASAVRRTATVSELNKVIFTPCPICENDEAKTPSVSIQADKAVQDNDLRAILYRNVVFRLGGVPVFYLPAFAHPDPSVERASGFLGPIPDYDQGRGGSLEIPYLHVVSPSEDWVISPQFNTNVAPLLNAQWRRRFDAGTLIVRGGYTYERLFGEFDIDGDGQTENGVKYGDRTHRSYLLANGKFDLSGPWRWGFTAEQVSDKTLFDQYSINDPYQDKGLYYGDRRRLISQIYAERQTQRSYLSIAAFKVQSLRVTEFSPLTPALNIFEDDSTLPIVAPLIDARWEPDSPVWGGRLRLKASSVSLFRDAYVGFPTLSTTIAETGPTAGLPGVDSNRLTLGGEWRRSFISPLGIRYEPFIDARFDAYAVRDLPPAAGVEDDVITRGRASLGLDISYPLYKRLSSTSDLVIEPRLQASISNRTEIDPRIPNEDSQTIELDKNSIFSMDRFPGYDLLEGGARLTAGLSATYTWDTTSTLTLFVGRSMRDQDINNFLTPIPDDPTRVYDSSGLSDRTSDWVVQADFKPTDRLHGWAHATIDGNGDIRRAETTINGGWGRRNDASVSYIIDRSNPLEGPLNRNYELIQAQAQQFVYGNWGVALNGIADLEQNIISRSEVGILFDDDCFRIEFGWRRDNSRVRPTGPAEGVYVRLNLATFGGSGYGRN